MVSHLCEFSTGCPLARRTGIITESRILSALYSNQTRNQAQSLNLNFFLMGVDNVLRLVHVFGFGSGYFGLVGLCESLEFPSQFVCIEFVQLPIPPRCGVNHIAQCLAQLPNNRSQLGVIRISCEHLNQRVSEVADAFIERFRENHHPVRATSRPEICGVEVVRGNG